ncbi:MAG: hypothetical protein ACKVTZ_02880 [Bacteroidia bacterium]
MKKFLFVAKAVCSATLLIVLVTGCQRERWIDNDELEVRRSVMAEDYFDDASTVTDQAMLSDGTTLDNYKTDGVGDALGECATVTRDEPNKTITIEFGKQTDGSYANCLCKDGKNRRGKIVVTYTGAYREVGTEITTNMVDFYVNDNKVEGTKVVKNMGENTAGNVYFTLHADGKITLASNNQVMTWVTDREREWLEGFDTKTWVDDVYRVTGGGSGVKADGLTYTVQITKALIRKVACRQFVAGIVEVTPGSKAKRTIDFGNGECDNEAVVSIGNRSKTITLKH